MNTIQNVFAESRKPEDLDLVKEITNILSGLGHKAPDNWKNDPTVMEASTAAPKLQRFLINRYWRYTLGMHSENTTRERYCLVDTGEDAEYLKIFKDAVAPFIIKHQL